MFIWYIKCKDYYYDFFYIVHCYFPYCYYSFSSPLSSYFIFILSLFGSIFTTLYSVKVWYYCFVWGVNMNRSINRGPRYKRYTRTFHSLRSTPPPPLVMPILNSLLIDESPEHCFSLSSFTLFYSSSLFAYSSGVTGLGILLFILINLLLYWMFR